MGEIRLREQIKKIKISPNITKRLLRLETSSILQRVLLVAKIPTGKNFSNTNHLVKELIRSWMNVTNVKIL